MLIARNRVRSLSDISCTDAPSITTSPLVTSSMPEKVLSSVVFPEPDGPITATICPLPMERSIPCRACTSISPARYVFTTLCASIMFVTRFLLYHCCTDTIASPGRR